ncbi:leucine-rich repeat-containing protein 51-like isoform X1 [Ciona intestinalis]
MVLPETVKDSPSSSKSPSQPTAGPPLDLSFKCMLSSSDIADEAETHTQNNLVRSRSGKAICNAIRMNNNSLNDINGLDKTVADIVENPDEIAWIDLSFNELNTIDKVLTLFKNVRVLYLHGNTIEKIHEVQKLSSLPHLRNLTLHGNPIETERGYRQYVLSVLPGLRTLDFSGVTKQDRSGALTWSAMNKKTRRRKNSTS